MKKFLFVGMLALALAGCSSNASIRILNNLPRKINVSLQPAAGSTLNVNDVSPGATTTYYDVPEGNVRIHISTSGTNPADVDLAALKDKRYTATVNPGPPPVTTVQPD